MAFDHGPDSRIGQSPLKSACGKLIGLREYRSRREDHSIQSYSDGMAFWPASARRKVASRGLAKRLPATASATAYFADGTIENFFTGAIFAVCVPPGPGFFPSGHGTFFHRSG
jgi:hypothetical protein